jgi:UDPglucose 6-dehydrogenase
MKISVIGTGYVGLVTGACLADVGNDVVCVDIDERKVATLRSGGIPIHEPGLEGLVRANVEAGRLRFTSDVQDSVRHGQVQFIAVGTPAGEDGSADLQHVLAAAGDIARFMSADKVVINKSTVPVGTGRRVSQVIRDELDKRGAPHSFAVVSNPEFLKEGAAIGDFMRPDRIVIGAEDERAIRVMRQLYAPFERNRAKLMVMDIESAELTKYAANAMLATRISFMNELALLAERVGANIDDVRLGIGSDPRIGSHFLYAGCGYGGSCFPKDVKALLRTAVDAGSPLRVVAAVEEANAAQKRVLVDKIVARFGPTLSGLSFGIWGLAFKPDTDDMREAPSLVVIEELLQRGATIRAYDPVASLEAQRLLKGRPGITFAGRAMEAAEGADAAIIVTEWKEFRSPDLQRLKEVLKQPVVLDGRNILDPTQVREAGLEYLGVGRP